MHSGDSFLENLVVVIILVNLLVQLVNGVLLLAEFPLNVFFLSLQSAYLHVFVFINN